MRKIASLFAHAFFYSLAIGAAFGQSTPQPTPPSSADTETLKISTTLIQIDVTVTDKNGKIIADLKPEDFEIFENGEKQEITDFTFVSSETETASTAKVAGGPRNLPNSVTRPEQIRRTIALVVDDLTITYENFGDVKKSLRKFVGEQMREGDLVAIARTGGSIGILQQFTGDRRHLYAAIEKLRWNPLGLGGAKFVLPGDSISISGDSAIGLRSANAESDEFRASSIAANMIGGINYFISGMRNLPGRKSAVIFSEGFSLLKRDIVGPERSFRVEAALEKLFDTAARSSVVISTIDVRGLELQTGEATNDTQDGLKYLAEQTGGTAIGNTNDFNLGVEKILSEQKSYYLLGYAPDADTFDASKRRFNKLIVKVKRSGANARYRSGFFGQSDERETAAGNQTPAQRLVGALVAPLAANDIGLTLSALFAADDRQGSFVRSLLHIDAQDLNFTVEADGSRKAVFDVLAVGFNAEGAQVDKIVKNYVLNLPAEDYERLRQTGFVYYFVFPFAKPGAYQLRVAVRDSQSEKIGSASQFVEIPNLQAEELTLSGVVLKRLSLEEWQRQGRGAPDSAAPEQAGNSQEGDSLTDTSLRRFKRDAVLRYGLEIYNARLDAARRPNLSTQINVWREGKLFFSGKPTPVEAASSQNPRKNDVSGALLLGREMPPGDYVLQIIVTDNLAKGKNKTTEQFVQLEIE